MGTASAINARVRAQYEAFPYPDYALLLPLRAQEAYASHSLFAARLLGRRGRMPAAWSEPSPRVLLAGCGDTFPYMAAAWEPRRHRLAALDLSARSLRRARLRCLPLLRPLEWIQDNLEDTEADLPGGLAHLDCYGVLHHLADPARALRRLAGLLLPGGTARIMVYNSAARGWLRHLQRAFGLMGLSAHDGEDRAAARRLLERLAAASPALRERLAPLRREALSHPARLVDTFLHAREARLGLGWWLQALAGAGLEVIGVYDRYGELDDLPNPLLEPPERAAWEARIADRRFENNLELWLARTDAPAAVPGRGIARGGARPAMPLALKAPPAAWFSYRDTCRLPWLDRRRIWGAFLAGLRGKTPDRVEAWAGRLPPEALQRLGRLGALLPEDFASRELRDLLMRPIHDSMEPPDFPPPVPLREERALSGDVGRLLARKARPSRYLDPVLRRLEAAQRP